jgi:hypothetical protein
MPRRRVPLLLALGGALLTVAPVAAQTAACRGLEPIEPEIRVTVDPARVRYDYGRSREEIQEMARRGGSSIPGGVPLGLTAAEENIEIRLTTERVERRGGWCMAPRAAEITLGQGPTTVYVDRRYPAGSCQRRVIEEHENEHVRINRESLPHWREPVAAAAAEVLQGWGWRSGGGTPEALAERWQSELMAAVTAALADLRATRDRHHARIDTRQSYERLTRRCPRW